MPTQNPGPATAHQIAIDGLVDEMRRQASSPISLVAGPWPLTADDAGIADDVLRALLADDWADPGMKANQLRKLVEVQVVARKRQDSANHPGGRDIGVRLDDAIVGRLLVDLDDDNVDPADAAVTLVDIAVHPRHQRQGVGSEVLRALLAAAETTGHRVRVSAVFGTASLRWFLASGFVDTGGDALFRQLVWAP